MNLFSAIYFFSLLLSFPFFLFHPQAQAARFVRFISLSIFEKDFLDEMHL